MANRWGEKMDTLTDFIFLSFEITADSDCSHEIKRSLLLGRKSMTNPDSILKIRDITWLTKVRITKAMVFPVVMYRWESWMIHWRIGAFELWCQRRLSRVPWTARRSNQSILKEISAEYSLEGLMLKLKPHYFGHFMQRANSLEKTQKLGKIKDKRRREWQGWDRRHHWFNGHEFEHTPGNSEGQGSLVCCCPWGHKEADTT